jgi:DNA-binding transcriptional ArsR family regulator
MTSRKFDLLLHPVRMQIVQAFVGDRQMSAQELGERLADVPPATLYRHLNALYEGGILQVAGERQVRGTTERFYTLPQERMSISPEEMRAATPGDHMRYFTTFVAGLLGSFSRYLKRPRIDLAADGVGYRQITLHLTDDELRALVADIDDRLRRELDNATGGDRTPRVITRIIMPESQPKEE